MKRALARIFACAALACAAAACVIAEPSPYAHGLLQPGYNHAWNNAVDAMKDKGVSIALADVAGGRLEGRRGGITVIGLVETQKLGDVQARFSASGAVAEDPGLAQRVQRRFEARMAN